MKLLTTKDLIKILSEQDMEGDRVVSFRAIDDDGEIAVFGELYPKDISITLNSARQTDEGDKDILRITLYLTRG